MESFVKKWHWWLHTCILCKREPCCQSLSFLSLNFNYHLLMTQGYKQKKGFIIAENPMESTVSTFVRMLHERECGVVVMLCGSEEGGMDICAPYWTTTSFGTATKHGEFTVSTESIKQKGDITQRVITISDTKVWCMKYSHCTVMYSRTSIIRTPLNWSRLISRPLYKASRYQING